MLYSAQTNGFYDVEIHGDSMPADVVEITDERYYFLLDGQSHGKLIAASSDGIPVLQDRPMPTQEELILIAQNNRKAAYIAEADPLFFKAQRGEVEQQVWLDKIAEIKARFPK
jgi:hypothetical protein